MRVTESDAPACQHSLGQEKGRPFDPVLCPRLLFPQTEPDKVGGSRRRQHGIDRALLAGVAENAQHSARAEVPTGRRTGRRGIHCLFSLEVQITARTRRVRLEISMRWSQVLGEPKKVLCDAQCSTEHSWVSNLVPAPLYFSDDKNGKGRAMQQQRRDC